VCFGFFSSLLPLPSTSLLPLATPDHTPQHPITPTPPHNTPRHSTTSIWHELPSSTSPPHSTPPTPTYPYCPPYYFLLSPTTSYSPLQHPVTPYNTLLLSFGVYTTLQHSTIPMTPYYFKNTYAHLPPPTTPRNILHPPPVPNALPHRLTHVQHITIGYSTLHHPTIPS
jgi:hypothetical protein